MEVGAFIEQCAERGIRLSVVEGRIRAEGSRPPNPDVFLSYLRRRKPELLEALQAPPVAARDGRETGVEVVEKLPKSRGIEYGKDSVKHRQSLGLNRIDVEREMTLLEILSDRDEHPVDDLPEELLPTLKRLTAEGTLRQVTRSRMHTVFWPREPLPEVIPAPSGSIPQVAEEWFGGFDDDQAGSGGAAEGHEDRCADGSPV